MHENPHPFLLSLQGEENKEREFRKEVFMEQSLGKGTEDTFQPQTEIVVDHTGARHTFPVYDVGQAERDAIALRGEVLWPDWNDTMRGREWG